MVELAPALIPLFPFWQAEESFLFPPLGEWPQGEWPHLGINGIIHSTKGHNLEHDILKRLYL